MKMTNELRTVYDLMHATARKLSGKRLQLRFEHNPGYKAVCRTDETGIMIIDLDPDLSYQGNQEYLRIYLHEISHAKNHKFKPMPIEQSNRIEPIIDKVYNRQETQADREAYKWQQYAEQNRDANQSYIEGCLWALYNSEF